MDQNESNQIQLNWIESAAKRQKSILQRQRVDTVNVNLKYEYLQVFDALEKIWKECDLEANRISKYKFKKKNPNNLICCEIVMHR